MAIFPSGTLSLLLLCFVSTAVYHASIPEHDQGMKIDTSKYPPESGITLELCAGILDKDLPPEETARIEVLEECGYDVPVSNFERIITYR
jgi:UDP-sugar diphosphatase